MYKEARESKLCNNSTINTGIKISKSKSIEQNHECNFLTCIWMMYQILETMI